MFNVIIRDQKQTTPKSKVNKVIIPQHIRGWLGYLISSLHLTMNSQLSHKFLVTGGGGYIGFHIGLRLLQLQHEVTLFDISYPSKKWDPNMRYSHSTNVSEDDNREEISCTYGTMKFIKGK